MLQTLTGTGVLPWPHFCKWLACQAGPSTAGLEVLGTGARLIPVKPQGNRLTPPRW